MNTIRTATPADIDGIFRLWQQLMDSHKQHHRIFEYEPEQIPVLRDTLLKRMEDPHTQMFICETASAITGLMVAVFRATPPGYALKAKGYIAETVVDETAQGQGIGNLLYQAALDWFREQGADHIELQVSPHNPGGQAFWQKKGFEETSKHLILTL